MIVTARARERIAGRPLGARLPSGTTLLAGGLLLLLLWLVLPPFVTMLQTSLATEEIAGEGAFTTAHYEAVFQNILGGSDVLLSSAVFAGGSAVVALFLGTIVAWLAERTNAPFRTFAYVAAFVSFAIPGIIKVIAWIILLGPNAGFFNLALVSMFGLQEGPLNLFSLGGMIFLEGLLWMPIVFLLMATPFRSMDPSLEEAAATSGASGWQTFQRVTLHLALPSVMAVLILTFVRSLEAFEIPALIGIPAGVEVLTTQIFLEIGSGFFPRYGEASAYAAVLVAFIVLAFIPYYRLTNNSQTYATVTGKGFRPRRIELGKWRYVAGVVMLVLPALELLPLLVMLWLSVLPFVQPPSLTAVESFTLANYPRAFSNSNVSVAIVNSAVVSTVSAFAVTIVTLLVAWVLIRTNVRWRWLLDQLATLPLVFPGIVLGLAVLRTYLVVPLPVYGTLWILVIAYLTRYLPYGMRFTHAGLLGIHRDLEESAEMSGATWFSRMRHIIVPLLLPALFASWIYVFLVTSRELSAALLLSSPGTQVISVAFWELWENGQVTELSAFSVVITAGLVVLSFAFHYMTRGRNTAV